MSDCLRDRATARSGRGWRRCDTCDVRSGAIQEGIDEMGPSLRLLLTTPPVNTCDAHQCWNVRYFIALYAIVYARRHGNLVDLNTRL
jgi:hypothetical protein